MGPDLLAIFVIVVVLAGGTKAGRAFLREAWKATGWRGPRAAIRHHSPRLGAMTGRAIGGGSRKFGRGAARMGRNGATGLFHTRRGPLIPLMWGLAANPDAAAAPAGSGSAPGSPAAPAPSPAGPGSATDYGPGPWALTARSRSGRKISALKDRDTETIAVWDRDDLKRRLKAAAADPDMDISVKPLPSRDDPGTGTGPVPSATTASAPPGARRRNTRMTTHLAVNLEPPTTDGEFLESCNDLASALKAFAEAVGNWSEGLSALNLAQSVTNPLHQVSDGITEAAAGAAQSAQAFEDEYEDAREVASRGMKFTGQDAA